MTQPVRPARRNVHGSLLLGKLPKSMAAFREGHAGSRAGVVSRAFADLDGTSANGLLTRKSPGLLGRARESRREECVFSNGRDLCWPCWSDCLCVAEVRFWRLRTMTARTVLPPSRLQPQR